MEIIKKELLPSVYGLGEVVVRDQSLEDLLEFRRSS